MSACADCGGLVPDGMVLFYSCDRVGCDAPLCAECVGRKLIAKGGLEGRPVYCNGCLAEGRLDTVKEKAVA